MPSRRMSIISVLAVVLFIAGFAVVIEMRMPPKGSPTELAALQQQLQTVSDQQCKNGNGTMGLPLFNNPRIKNGRVIVDVGHDSGFVPRNSSKDEAPLRARFGNLVDVHEYGAGGEPICALPD